MARTLIKTIEQTTESKQWRVLSIAGYDDKDDYAENTDF